MKEHGVKDLKQNLIQQLEVEIEHADAASRWTRVFSDPKSKAERLEVLKENIALCESIEELSQVINENQSQVKYLFSSEFQNVFLDFFGVNQAAINFENKRIFNRSRFNEAMYIPADPFSVSKSGIYTFNARELFYQMAIVHPELVRRYLFAVGSADLARKEINGIIHAVASDPPAYARPLFVEESIDNELDLTKILENIKSKILSDKTELMKKNGGKGSTAYNFLCGFQSYLLEITSIDGLIKDLKNLEAQHRVNAPSYWLLIMESFGLERKHINYECERAYDALMYRRTNRYENAVLAMTTPRMTATNHLINIFKTDTACFCHYLNSLNTYNEAKAKMTELRTYRRYQEVAKLIQFEQQQSKTLKY